MLHFLLFGCRFIAFRFSRCVLWCSVSVLFSPRSVVRLLRMLVFLYNVRFSFILISLTRWFCGVLGVWWLFSLIVGGAGVIAFHAPIGCISSSPRRKKIREKNEKIRKTKKIFRKEKKNKKRRKKGVKVRFCVYVYVVCCRITRIDMFFRRFKALLYILWLIVHIV